MNQRPRKRIDLGFGSDAAAAVADRNPSKRPRLAPTVPVETKVETKGGEKLARGRVRGEKAVDGEKISASKKRREKKKKAKAARAAGKADGDIPAKQTHAAIEYLREWAKAQATSDSTPTHGWKFQKVRQTWLLKNSTDPSKIVKPDFKILLEYLKGLQGKSLTETVAAAQKNADDLHNVGDGEEDAFNRIKKKRAEKIIKMLGKA